MKKLKFLPPFMLFLIFIVCVTCYYDSEEYLFPDIGNSCDTANVTYSVSVADVLTNSCVNCHNSGNASGGVKLNSYTEVKLNADNGSLMGSITHAANYKAMPQGAPKLDDCNIAMVQKWIDAGSPNN